MSILRSMIGHKIMMATAELVLAELTRDYPAHYSMIEKMECFTFEDWLDFIELTGL